VDRAEPAELDSVRDRPAIEAKLQELGPGDHPVLALRERPNHPIRLTLAPFYMHVM
jgi:hypothetical protein